MRIAVALLTLATLAGPLTAFSGPLKAAEEEHDFWWYQKAKLACMGDVMRLCAKFVPDEDQVRSCMKTKRSQVSAGCAEFYPGGKNAD
jgi:hypothetical protein